MRKNLHDQVKLASITDVSRSAQEDSELEEGSDRQLKKSIDSDKAIYDGVTPDHAAKRGYNDFADFCMDYNCGDRVGDSYVQCIRENNCA